MKKYIQPQTCAFMVTFENMLAASKFDMNCDSNTKVDQALSEEKDAWGSDSWSTFEE